MNRLLPVLGMLVTTVATESHRGLAVEGWAYNGLPWRITNVRVRVDSVDTNGTVIASAAGWSWAT